MGVGGCLSWSSDLQEDQRWLGYLDWRLGWAASCLAFFSGGSLFGLPLSWILMANLFQRL